MDDTFTKLWHTGGPSPFGHAAQTPPASVARVLPLINQVTPRGIDFGVDPGADIHGKGRVPIPGYDTPALPLKPIRDPSLSLVALSGIDPAGSVMREVPLVQNNGRHKAEQALAGRRIGFADQWVQGNRREPMEHTAAFLRVLDTLRQAGVHLVPVPAQRVDSALQFNLHTRNEIDEHISEYRLDALVSDSRSAAFHAACWSGYPGLSEPLEEGATLWFYGARWAGGSLAALVREYRRLPGLNTAAAARGSRCLQ